MKFPSGSSLRAVKKASSANSTPSLILPARWKAATSRFILAMRCSTDWLSSMRHPLTARLRDRGEDRYLRVVQASPTVCELRHIERPSVCGVWKYHTSNDLDELIVSIDRRTENARMESSLIGVWFQSAIDSQLSSEEPLLIVP